MNYTGVSINDFIKHIIKFNDVYDIINPIENLSIRGFVYMKDYGT